MKIMNQKLLNIIDIIIFSKCKYAIEVKLNLF